MTAPESGRGLAIPVRGTGAATPQKAARSSSSAPVIPSRHVSHPGHLVVVTSWNPTVRLRLARHGSFAHTVALLPVTCKPPSRGQAMLSWAAEKLNLGVEPTFRSVTSLPLEVVDRLENPSSILLQRPVRFVVVMGPS